MNTSITSPIFKNLNHNLKMRFGPRRTLTCGGVSLRLPVETIRQCFMADQHSAIYLGKGAWFMVKKKPNLPPLNVSLLFATGAIKDAPRKPGFFTNLRRYMKTGVWF